MKVKDIIPFDFKSCYCAYSSLNLKYSMCQKRNISVSSRLFVHGLQSDHKVLLSAVSCRGSQNPEGFQMFSETTLGEQIL